MKKSVKDKKVFSSHSLKKRVVRDSKLFFVALLSMDDFKLTLFFEKDGPMLKFFSCRNT